MFFFSGQQKKKSMGYIEGRTQAGEAGTSEMHGDADMSLHG
jgi:hypothetical protein